MGPGFLFGNEGAPPKSNNCATQDTCFPFLTFCFYLLFLFSGEHPEKSPSVHVRFFYRLKKILTLTTDDFYPKPFAMIHMAGGGQTMMTAGQSTRTPKSRDRLPAEAV
jgi:hypothetical protein